MNEIWTTAEAAAYLNIKAQTLTVWRSSGRYGLKFIRVGRAIRYRKSDIDAWLEQRSATSVAGELALRK